MTREQYQESLTERGFPYTHWRYPPGALVFIDPSAQDCFNEQLACAGQTAVATTGYHWLSQDRLHPMEWATYVPLAYQRRIYAIPEQFVSPLSALPPSSPSHLAPCQNEGNKGRGRLIMVIDDSPTVRKVVETSLGREGFLVTSFPDGIEAMRWLASAESRVPDLVLLDIGLPRLDGYEVARRLKAKPWLSTLIIIMLTRRDGVLDRLKARLAGAKDCISKPCKTQDLLAMLEVYLGSAGQEVRTSRIT